VLARAFGAAGAAEYIVFSLDAVADDLTSAMGANRGQLVDRTFERVEYVPASGRYDLKAHVVIVAANFTARHFYLLWHLCLNGLDRVEMFFECRQRFFGKSL
jgi:hypothetical protein